MAVISESIKISSGFSNLAIIKQVGLFVGLAASIAIGVGVADWSKSPDYRVMYSNLVIEDASEIAASLQRSNIKYRISDTNGSIMVPAEDLQEARMMLASEGLPKGAGDGYELLDNNSGFGVSNFMENIRYQRALEGELSRTITSIKNVRSARVHLALPKTSVFMREKKKATASVTLDLFPGRVLDNGQVSAIAHLVAASIPDLESENVVVVNQKGKLLSSDRDSSDIGVTFSQLDYKQKLENYYIERIENILTPMLGSTSIRAQVSADIDFTRTEQTSESFNPDLPAIRSEQLFKDITQSIVNSGVPGSLSNQPQETVFGSSFSGAPKSNEKILTKTTRSYELDKTISHIRFGGNLIKKISVAVVIDYNRTINNAGDVVNVPLSKERIVNITNLIKEVVGFDVSRGDTINVINSEFFKVEEEVIIIEEGFLDNPNIIVIGKYIGAGLLILVIVFGVLKPIMKDLASNVTRPSTSNIQGQGDSNIEGQAVNNQGQSTNSYESNITQAQGLASSDPKRVAQVVNSWVSSDG